MVALVVDEPDGVEDLHRPVRVEAGDDLRDRAEVPVHEVAEAPVVVDRAGAGAAADEELEVGDAERVLDVDGEQADPERVVRRRADPVLLGPRSCLARALLVGDAPDLADPLSAGRNRAQATRALRASLVPGLRIRAAMPMSTWYAGRG